MTDPDGNENCITKVKASLQFVILTEQIFIINSFLV